MSTEDRFETATEKLSGQAKEGYGKLTGDKEAEVEGKTQQLGAEAKEKVQDLKDGAKGAVEGLRGDDDR